MYQAEKTLTLLGEEATKSACLLDSHIEDVEHRGRAGSPYHRLGTYKLTYLCVASAPISPGVYLSLS